VQMTLSLVRCCRNRGGSGSQLDPLWVEQCVHVVGYVCQFFYARMFRPVASSGCSERLTAVGCRRLWT
jgi:hypothetical protein